jgi:hypothetical protein
LLRKAIPHRKAGLRVVIFIPEDPLDLAEGQGGKGHSLHQGVLPLKYMNTVPLLTPLSAAISSTLAAS